MSAILDIASVISVFVGTVFFVSGTVGLLRFPDVYSRLHALTKCDNLGIGFIALGSMMQAPSFAVALKILAAWIFVLIASSAAAHLIAYKAKSSGVPYSKNRRK